MDDSPNWGEALEKQGSYIRSLIRAKLGDVSDADQEDIYSEVIIGFLRAVDEGGFEGQYGEASIKAWLKKAVEGKCVDWIRKATKERENIESETWDRDRGIDKRETRQAKPLTLEGKKKQKDEEIYRDSDPEFLRYIMERYEKCVKHMPHRGIFSAWRHGISKDEIARMFLLTRAQVKGRLEQCIKLYRENLIKHGYYEADKNK